MKRSATATSGSGSSVTGPPHRLISALREVVIVAVVYGLYSIVRNLFGSARTTPAVAFANAERIIEAERSLGLYVELEIQQAFIERTTFMQFWNLYYGLFHLLFTATALVLAFVLFDPDRYAWWRNTLVFSTITALAGYAGFPLMPPRLLPDCGEYGACQAPADMQFVDTVTDIGGIWAFESGFVERVTNQYAAMPSLHIGWSVWVAALALSVWLRRRSLPRAWRTQILVGIGVAHPFFTLFGVVVTGNHYWLDAVGGIAVVAAGCVVAYLIGRCRSHVGIVKVLPKVPDRGSSRADPELSS